MRMDLAERYERCGLGGGLVSGRLEKKSAELPSIVRGRSSGTVVRRPFRSWGQTRGYGWYQEMVEGPFYQIPLRLCVFV